MGQCNDVAATTANLTDRKPCHSCPPAPAPRRPPLQATGTWSPQFSFSRARGQNDVMMS